VKESAADDQQFFPDEVFTILLHLYSSFQSGSDPVFPTDA
jgi:hypothetical protein